MRKCRSARLTAISQCVHTPEHLMCTTNAVVWNVPQSPCVKAWSPAIERRQDLSRWGLVEGSWATCSYHLKGLQTQKSLCLWASQLDGSAFSIHTSSVTCFAVSEPKKQITSCKLTHDPKLFFFCLLKLSISYFGIEMES